MTKVIKASGNEVEPYWPSLFAKALKGQNIEELLSSITSAPVGGAAASSGAVAADAGAAKAAPVEESILLTCFFAKHHHYREKGGRSCRCRYGWFIWRRRILSRNTVLHVFKVSIRCGYQDVLSYNSQTQLIFNQFF